MKQALYDLVDTRQYVATNCFQHQLTRTLDARLDVERMELAELRPNSIPAGATALVRLKLRTFAQNIDKLEAMLMGTNIIVYEQDTWENFLTSSPYCGTYQEICKRFNVLSFLNMSHWWSDLVRSCGMPSRFIQVWMLPEYCPEPTRWLQKTHDVVFCGTMYPHRVAFFDKLRTEGVDVEVVPAGKGYSEYLQLLSSSKISIRSELINWEINAGNGPFVVTRPNAQWQRDIECAARGCVSMREVDDEMKLWSISDIPSIVPFETPREAAENIRNILTRSPEQMDEILKHSVDVVRAGRGWQTVPDVIEELVG